jgi:uroporphyrinogen-III synthase
LAVWITRSQPGADRQAEEIGRRGHDVVVAPVIDIEPTRASEPEGPYDCVVFLSEQAVRHGGSLGYCADAEVYAVGEQTARTLESRGVPARVPETASSEGLIRALEDVIRAGTSVLVVAGEDGRPTLVEHLRGRAAVVSEFLCYRRVPAAVRPEQLAGVDTVLVASRDGFRHVARLWFDQGGDARLRVLAASPRIAELGGELGFRNVETARGASTEDWLTALGDDKDGNG